MTFYPIQVGFSLLAAATLVSSGHPIWAVIILALGIGIGSDTTAEDEEDEKEED